MPTRARRAHLKLVYLFTARYVSFSSNNETTTIYAIYETQSREMKWKKKEKKVHCALALWYRLRTWLICSQIIPLKLTTEHSRLTTKGAARPGQQRFQLLLRLIITSEQAYIRHIYSSSRREKPLRLMLQFNIFPRASELEQQKESSAAITHLAWSKSRELRMIWILFLYVSFHSLFFLPQQKKLSTFLIFTGCQSFTAQTDRAWSELFVVVVWCVVPPSMVETKAKV